MYLIDGQCTNCIVQIKPTATNDNKRLAELKAKNLTISQLKKWKVKYNSIYFGKISYDMLVDDRALFFKKNWTKYLKHLE